MKNLNRLIGFFDEKAFENRDSSMAEVTGAVKTGKWDFYIASADGDSSENEIISLYPTERITFHVIKDKARKKYQSSISIRNDDCLYCSSLFGECFQECFEQIPDHISFIRNFNMESVELIRDYNKIKEQVGI